MAAETKTIILGVNSLIAPWLIKRLEELNYSGRLYSRTPTTVETDNFNWLQFDALNPSDFNPPADSIIISLLPLWLLTGVQEKLTDCRQLIAFSTTSIFGKQNSSNPEEQKLVQQLKVAEADIIRTTEKRNIPWTILRPTMIYDGHNDQNITVMAQFIKKWRVLPIASPANGLRQPVHADDLAAAVISTMGNPNSYNKSFNLGGGETLTYRQMVERVFQKLGSPPRILSLPFGMIRLIGNLSRLSAKNEFNTEMFIRMNQDLIYDFSAAQRALNYSPRPFQPDFHQLERM